MAKDRCSADEFSKLLEGVIDTQTVPLSLRYNKTRSRKYQAVANILDVNRSDLFKVALDHMYENLGQVVAKERGISLEEARVMIHNSMEVSHESK